MDYLNAVVLGVIEGITEFLPISSTGHLLIAEHWLGQRSDTFNIVIQAGAMLAVTIIYWRRIIDLLLGWQQPANRDYLFKLIVAFMITAILGLLATKLGFVLPETVTPIAWALVIGGGVMIAAEQYLSRQPDQTAVTWWAAIITGFAQLVAAIFPGTSRSGATIFGAMLGGATNRAAATEFAFLVGLPTMYAASAYELLAAVKDGAPHEDWAIIAVGFVVATIIAFIAVKWLLGFIQTNRFFGFAIYRIILGGLLLSMASMGWIA